MLQPRSINRKTLPALLVVLLLLSAPWLCPNSSDLAPAHAAPSKKPPALRTATPAVDPSADSTGKPVFLTGGVATFGLLTDDVQRQLGFLCAKQNDGRTRIQEVRPYSEALAANLQRGDVILDARHDGGSFTLAIERAGAVYRAKLSDGTALAPGKPLVDPNDYALRAPMDARTDRPQFNLSLQKQGQALARYNVELIVDRSMSMRKTDCPGGLARWEWCAVQARTLAQAISPYAPRGLTLTRFAKDFDVHEHADTNTVVELMSRGNLQFGTRMAEPLQNRLKHYFQTRRAGDKPLLIAVISDGVPVPRWEPQLVIDTLVEASHYVNKPNEVTVVFFQIGERSPRGVAFLHEVATNLRSYGARYQLAHMKTFEDVQMLGLGGCLTQVVEQSARQ